MLDAPTDKSITDENDYDNSLQFRLHLQSTDSNFESLAREISHHIGITRPRDVAHLRVLLANLLLSHRQCKWLVFSRDRNRYTKKSMPPRYNPVRLGYALVKVADALKAHGFIEMKLGFHDRETGIGRKTRIRAAASLCARLNALPVATRLKLHPRAEGIVLKDSNKNLIEYRDTQKTRRIRRELGLINAQISSSRIDMPDGTHDAGQLCRIFNNGSFAQGGRFYWGRWETLPKRERAKLRIDGRSVVEKDFSGMHIRMLYAKVGVDCPDDPYRIPGYESDSMRKAMKVVALICLNAENRLKAIGAIQNRKRDEPDLFPEGFPIGQAIDDFLLHHQGISHCFFGGELGLWLQNKDAEIANRVMLEMAKEGITVLPVHDSFIVSEQHEDRLKQVMANAYRQVMGGEAAIHCIVSLFIAEIYRESAFLGTRASNHLLIVDRHNKSLTLNLRPGRAPLLR